MASAAEPESKATPKYRAILKSMTGLVDFICGGDPMKLALRLFEKELLNENTYDEFLLGSITGTEKARRIVNEVLKKVKVDPDETYEKFIEVLNTEKMLDAVKLIKKKYKGKCIHLLRDFHTKCDYSLVWQSNSFLFLPNLIKCAFFLLVIHLWDM